MSRKYPKNKVNKVVFNFSFFLLLYTITTLDFVKEIREKEREREKERYGGEEFGVGFAVCDGGCSDCSVHRPPRHFQDLFFL